MEGHTAFISYVLIPTTVEATGFYSQAIHCNYIKKIDLGSGNPFVQEISLNFPDINDFKFLATSVVQSPDIGTLYIDLYGTTSEKES